MYCIFEYEIKVSFKLGDLGKQESLHVHIFRKYYATVSVLTSPVILEGKFLGWVMCLVSIHLGLIHETSAELAVVNECLMINLCTYSAFICVKSKRLILQYKSRVTMLKREFL
jgi:hypothetical protein